jgi:hypothetical protein
VLADRPLDPIRIAAKLADLSMALTGRACPLTGSTSGGRGSASAVPDDGSENWVCGLAADTADIVSGGT